LDCAGQQGSNLTVDGLKRFTVLEGLTPEESDAFLQRCEDTTVKK